VLSVACDEWAPLAGGRRGFALMVSAGWSFCPYFRPTAVRILGVSDELVGEED
jgi:hypothetical protein